MMRLISSGIFLLNERQPASMCIMGIWSFAAAIETAGAVLVSPCTMTRWGDSVSRICSVCSRMEGEYEGCLRGEGIECVDELVE